MGKGTWRGISTTIDMQMRVQANRKTFKFFRLIVVNIYAFMCKLANEIQMCPKSEPAQLDLVAIPRPLAPSHPRKLLNPEPSQIKVASYQLPFISFVMCSDYIKFNLGEFTQSEREKVRDERKRIIGIERDRFRYDIFEYA